MAWTEKRKEEEATLSIDPLVRIKTWITANSKVLDDLKECYDLIEEQPGKDESTQYIFKLKDDHRGVVVVADEAEFQEVILCLPPKERVTLVDPPTKRWGLPKD